MKIVRRLEDESATRVLGEALAALLRPGDIVTLDGPLGAGKTTLVRSIASALGVDPSRVSSPTFVLMHEYPGAGGIRILHLDCYRMSGADELEGLGYDRAAGGAIVLVEWAERLAGDTWPGALAVRLEHTGESSRVASIDVPPEWRERTPMPRGDATCPITGLHVPADAPTWPFSSERARRADLYRWFSGGYGDSRPATEADFGSAPD